MFLLLWKVEWSECLTIPCVPFLALKKKLAWTPQVWSVPDDSCYPSWFEHITKDARKSDLSRGQSYKVANLDKWLRNSAGS